MSHRLLCCALISFAMLLQPVLAQEPEASLSLAETLEINGEFEKAVGEYERLAEKISSTKGPFTLELVPALVGLGRSYIKMGHLEQALDNLQRAQNVTHRNEGVYSPSQSVILELMTDLQLASEEPLEADRQQKFLFFISTHHFADLETLPAHIKLSQWYMETGQYRRAQKTA